MGLTSDQRNTAQYVYITRGATDINYEQQPEFRLKDGRIDGKLARYCADNQHKWRNDRQEFKERQVLPKHIAEFVSSTGRGRIHYPWRFPELATQTPGTEQRPSLGAQSSNGTSQGPEISEQRPSQGAQSSNGTSQGPTNGTSQGPTNGTSQGPQHPEQRPPPGATSSEKQTPASTDNGAANYDGPLGPGDDDFDPEVIDVAPLVLPRQDVAMSATAFHMVAIKRYGKAGQFTLRSDLEAGMVAEDIWSLLKNEWVQSTIVGAILELNFSPSWKVDGRRYLDSSRWNEYVRSENPPHPEEDYPFSLSDEDICFTSVYNISDVHWVMFVADRTTLEVTVFDSLDDLGETPWGDELAMLPPAVGALATARNSSKAWRDAGENWELRNGRSALQPNQDDCGIYAIQNVLDFMYHGLPLRESQNADYLRFCYSERMRLTYEGDLKHIGGGEDPATQSQPPSATSPPSARPAAGPTSRPNPVERQALTDLIARLETQTRFLTLKEIIAPVLHLQPQTVAEVQANCLIIINQLQLDLDVQHVRMALSTSGFARPLTADADPEYELQQVEYLRTSPFWQAGSAPVAPIAGFDDDIDWLPDLVVLPERMSSGGTRKQLSEYGQIDLQRYLRVHGGRLNTPKDLSESYDLPGYFVLPLTSRPSYNTVLRRRFDDSSSAWSERKLWDILQLLKHRAEVTGTRMKVVFVEFGIDAWSVNNDSWPLLDREWPLAQFDLRLTIAMPWHRVAHLGDLFTERGGIGWAHFSLHELAKAQELRNTVGAEVGQRDDARHSALLDLKRAVHDAKSFFPEVGDDWGHRMNADNASMTGLCGQSVLDLFGGGFKRHSHFPTISESKKCETCHTEAPQDGRWLRGLSEPAAVRCGVCPTGGDGGQLPPTTAATVPTVVSPSVDTSTDTGTPAIQHAPCTDCGTTSAKHWSAGFDGDGLVRCKQCRAKKTKATMAATEHAPCTDCRTTSAKEWTRGFNGDGLVRCRTCHKRKERAVMLATEHVPCTDCGTTSAKQWTAGCNGDGLVRCRACFVKKQKDITRAIDHAPCTAGCGRTKSPHWTGDGVCNTCIEKKYKDTAKRRAADDSERPASKRPRGDPR